VHQEDISEHTGAQNDVSSAANRIPTDLQHEKYCEMVWTLLLCKCRLSQGEEAVRKAEADRGAAEQRAAVAEAKAEQLQQALDEARTRVRASERQQGGTRGRASGSGTAGYNIATCCLAVIGVVLCMLSYSCSHRSEQCKVSACTLPLCRTPVSFLALCSMASRLPSCKGVHQASLSGPGRSRQLKCPACAQAERTDAPAGAGAVRGARRSGCRHCPHEAVPDAGDILRPGPPGYGGT